MESVNVSSVVDLADYSHGEDKVQIFSHSEFGEIRGLEIKGEPWFVGKDVASGLGYKNTKDALLTHIDKDDKDEVAIPDSIGRKQNTSIINESGLYSLILSSRLPSAKKFKRWVTSEVLPSIRKHGGYLTPNKIRESLSNPNTLIELLTVLKEEQDKRISLEVINKENEPKVKYAEAVETSETSILVGELARKLKENGLDIGQNRLFVWLRGNGYLIKGKRKDYNLPNQRSMDLGLMEIKQTPRKQNGRIVLDRTPVITGKGQIYFINKIFDEFGLCEGGLI
nr:phage antirepressor [Clostridioides sp.]